jgi:hypothetical protein
MSNMIECGTCGYPLTPEERTTLIEHNGRMILSKECVERGCMAYDDRVDVGVAMKQEQRGLREALAQERSSDEQPAQTDWEAVAADQALTIALLKAEQRHTAPQVTPQREWVGLTDEEFSHGLQMSSNTSWMKAAKWVEAKLRHKNTVRMRRATRDEKISNPGVYWVEDKE